MRPNYETGALLSARDLNEEQGYRLNRLRRHNRFLHGTGIVCGLGVFAAPVRQRPWSVVVCPGYAVGPCGDEIEVAVRVTVDIRNFLWSRPVANGVEMRVAFVCLRYAGEEAPAGCEHLCDCGCGCTPHEEDLGTRLHDGYAIEIVWSFQPGVVQWDLCKGIPSPCPALVTSPYVILAAVRLPASESTPLSPQDIFAV